MLSPSTAGMARSLCSRPGGNKWPGAYSHIPGRQFTLVTILPITDIFIDVAIRPIVVSLILFKLNAMLTFLRINPCRRYFLPKSFSCSKYTLCLHWHCQELSPLFSDFHTMWRKEKKRKDNKLSLRVLTVFISLLIFILIPVHITALLNSQLWLVNWLIVYHSSSDSNASCEDYINELTLLHYCHYSEG